MNENMSRSARGRENPKPAALAQGSTTPKRKAAKPAAPIADQGIAKRKSIQSVETGVKIIEALMEAREALPLRTISDTASMSRSQTHRYLLAYVNTGLVRQDPVSGYYDLGPMAIRVGLAALTRLDYIQQASAALAKLVKATGVTGIISIWGDFGPTVIRWIDGERPLITSLNIGSVLPTTVSSAGLVFLAHLPSARTKSILARETKRIGVSKRELDNQLSRVRQEGYAEVSGLVVPGLSAISAPVLDMQGNAVAALGLISRSDDDLVNLDDYVGELIARAMEAGKALGYDPRVHQAEAGL